MVETSTAPAGKRPIVGITFDNLRPGAPPTGKPELTWIEPCELLVDAAYQRDLSDASRKLIRRIVENWDWRRFKPPVTAWTDAGLEVIDGQHSAIAAATHPGIDLIPVVVVEATSQLDRAGAFIGHNRDRVAITPAQLHVAAVTAGDPDAIKAERLCALVGIQVLRLPPARANYRPRQTIAVSTLRWLVASEEEVDATYILRALADAELAPISAAHIRALAHLITAEEFEGLDRETLAKTVQSLGIKTAEQEAKEHCATHCVPLYRGLAAVWFKATKKRLRVANPAPESPARGAGATASPTPPVHAPSLGRDQPAGPAPAARSLADGDIKNDARSGRGSWKPGNYVRRCHTCDERFRGDGQAYTCADCAYGQEAAS